MCSKIRNKIITMLVLFLSVVIWGKLNVSAAEALTTVTTVDFRYNNQAPVGYFEVQGVDGKQHMAFCGWHEKKLPVAGWKMSTIEIYTGVNKKNEDLRKVLWYGFGGPGDIGANYAQTALGASVALGHMDTDDTGETEGPIGKTFLAQVKTLAAPPENYQVYCVRNLEETEYKHQCLVYAIYNPNGKVLLQKTTTDANIVNDNECYSLANAVYGVYSDQECTQKAGELVTNEKGTTNELELKPGKYFVKEEKAPMGYRLNKEIYEVNVEAEKISKVEAEDDPYSAVVDILAAKYDREKIFDLNGNLPQGAATLKGAKYKVEFYGCEINDIQEAEGKTPLYSWLLSTDEKGMIRLSQEYIVEGDMLMENSEGETILPMGSLLIYEMEAPEGYNLNSEKKLVKIKVNPEQGDVETFEVVQMPEDIIKGNVIIEKFYHKKDSNEKTPLEGIVFLFTSKTDGTEYRIITDAEGKASTEDLGGLPYDTYVVTEENTPAGFENAECFEVMIAKQDEILTYQIENKLIPKETRQLGTVRTGDTNAGMWYGGMLICSLIAIVPAVKFMNKKRHCS